MTGIDRASRRWYGDACGAALALDIVGERWALLVIRELLLGPRRFGELKAGLPGISANVLTQRLEGLERSGVVTRRRLPSPANAQVYQLTDWGYEAEPAIQALGRWALRSPTHDPTLPLTPASAVLSLRYLADPATLPAARASVAVRFGEERFVVRVAGGVVGIERGEGDAEASIETDTNSWIFCVYGKWPIDALEAAGRMRVAGDRAAFARFVDLFRLPPKAAVE